MKKIFALLLCLPFLIASCKKDKKTPYDKDITGLQLRDINAAPVQTVGTPDVNTTSDSFDMLIYPIPCSNLMNILITDHYPPSVSLTAKLVYVRYPGAPSSINTPTPKGEVTPVIENESKAGTVAMETTLPPAISGRLPMFTLDVSTLPQGFYRLYIETSDGKKFWDNTWIMR